MSNETLPAYWRKVPTSSGFLDVGESHSLYWCSFGRFDAMPVAVLHGGPGSGLSLRHLMFFDPAIHRVVLFDQRGCGRSTPSASVVGNTSQGLIEDIEKLRRHLDITRWLVFGVSWGACLALLYGQRYSRACNGLVLAGLPNRPDYQTAWILEKRAVLLPERHEAFLSPLTRSQRAAPIAAYYHKIMSAEQNDQRVATYAVSLLEAGLRGPEPEQPPAMTRASIDASARHRAKIYLHYWANKTFLRQAHLLINPTALCSLPVVMVHGASDWICPLSGAQLVADAIESAQLVVVPLAGHSPYDTGMLQALRESILHIC